jgi:hypothetical protein
MRKPVLLFAMVLIMNILFCGRSNVKTGESPYWNDLAKYLAGLPAGSESAFKTLTGEKGYAAHAARMNSFRELVRGRNLEQITIWQKQNLPVNRNEAFYPLSGADFINLNAFYPAAAGYIMIAMEETGPLPDPLSMTPAERQAGLDSIHRGVVHIGSQNYFTTAGMRKEFANPHFKGVLPVLLVFLSGMGHRVEQVDQVEIDPETGHLVPALYSGTSPAGSGNISGCKIRYRDAVDKTRRTLVYLSARIEPDSHLKSKPLGRFLSRAGRLNTLIKSAVYLFHREKYSPFARWILESSDTIIQDDSGIPYRYFDAAQWNTRLFGRYIYPKKLKDLQNPDHQPDLTKAYRESGEPLSFNFGYGVLIGKEKSNLLLARRKK